MAIFSLSSSCSNFEEWINNIRNCLFAIYYWLGRCCCRFCSRLTYTPKNTQSKPRKAPVNKGIKRKRKWNTNKMTFIYWAAALDVCKSSDYYEWNLLCACSVCLDVLLCTTERIANLTRINGTFRRWITETERPLSNRFHTNELHSEAAAFVHFPHTAIILSLWWWLTYDDERRRPNVLHYIRVCVYCFDI